MAHEEPERLVHQLQVLIERQASLRVALRFRLNDSLTNDERTEIERVIGIIDMEIADLERRLASLPPASGGTG